LNNRPLLITAGATRNPIDSIRCITANASGKTGAYIAETLKNLTQTTILGSNVALLHAPKGISPIEFTSTRDLESRMKSWVLQNPNGVVVHSSAVGDFEFSGATLDSKIPSGLDEINLKLTPTPKILPQIKAWSNSVSIISFKAAPPQTNQNDLEAIALNQCKRSHSRWVFANVIGNTNHNVKLVSSAIVHSFERRSEAMDFLVNEIKTLVLNL
jgi:phosphopantothenoylcysteine decarboxylase / phosphopantothenate---cysteine ligase